jgi:hypothetical protein
MITMGEVEEDSVWRKRRQLRCLMTLRMVVNWVQQLNAVPHVAECRGKAGFLGSVRVWRGNQRRARFLFRRKLGYE